MYFIQEIATNAGAIQTMITVFCLAVVGLVGMFAMLELVKKS